MPTTTESILGRAHTCGKPGCTTKVLSVELGGLKKAGGGTIVSVDVEPATVVYDHESALVAVQCTRTGLVGSKITVHQARGLMAAGLVRHLHECVGTRRS